MAEAWEVADRTPVGREGPSRSRNYGVFPTTWSRSAAKAAAPALVFPEPSIERRPFVYLVRHTSGTPKIVPSVSSGPNSPNCSTRSPSAGGISPLPGAAALPRVLCPWTSTRPSRRSQQSSPMRIRWLRSDIGLDDLADGDGRLAATSTRRARRPPTLRARGNRRARSLARRATRSRASIFCWPTRSFTRSGSSSASPKLATSCVGA
jgi:hypothetical protein